MYRSSVVSSGLGANLDGSNHLEILNPEIGFSSRERCHGKKSGREAALTAGMVPREREVLYRVYWKRATDRMRLQKLLEIM